MKVLSRAKIVASCVLLLLLVVVAVDGENNTGTSTQQPPNILLIVLDQERYPPHYVPEAVKEWWDNLPGKKALLKGGATEFASHRTSSTACCPSRATLYTGQMPSVHGVSQTQGLAKGVDDPAMTWLQPNDVPTMGNYFRAAGYDTYYIGKWHLSYEDILDDQNHVVEDPQAYQKANQLDKFGWSRWTGPEPHGASFSNLGWARDPKYVLEFEEFLQEKEREYLLQQEQNSSNKPWILALNLVNPHDIVVGDIAWKWAWQAPLKYSDTPQMPLPPTFNEDLKANCKPAIQQDYATKLRTIFPPIIFWEKFLQLYLFLIQTVDQHVHRVLTRLEQSTVFANSTVRVLTADHGDMQGAHGGMIQKWHQGYEETLHIPLIIQDPRVRNDSVTNKVQVPTQSLDILPTLLSLAGWRNQSQLQIELEKTHQEVHPFPGRDLTPLMAPQPQQQHNNPSVEWEFADNEPTTAKAITYFQLNDEVTKGESHDHPTMRIQPILRLLGILRFNTIGYSNNDNGATDAPTSIEGIVFQRTEDHHVIKCLRYYDDPHQWSEPGVRDVRDVEESGLWLYLLAKYIYSSTQTAIVRTEPLPDVWEVYDLTEDPSEENNLAAISNSPIPVDRLQRILARARKRYYGNRHIALPPTRVRNADLPSNVREHHEFPVQFVVGFHLLVFLVYGLGFALLWKLWTIVVGRTKRSTKTIKAKQE